MKCIIIFNMCFNAVITMPLEKAQEIYNLKLEKDFEYNGYSEFKSAFSNPFLPIILQDRVIGLGKWGLIPSWVRECKKAEEIVKYTINARVETLTEKPSFKGSVNNGRVLILLDGFYEWKHIDGKKIPYYISNKNSKPLLIAGLLSTWADVNTFSIITTVALGIMAEIHNTKLRMPFVLEEKDVDLWLDSKIPFKEVIKSIQPSYNELDAVQQKPNY